MPTLRCFARCAKINATHQRRCNGVVCGQVWSLAFVLIWWIDRRSCAGIGRLDVEQLVAAACTISLFFENLLLSKFSYVKYALDLAGKPQITKNPQQFWQIRHLWFTVTK
jgi:hypothetical protein